MPWQHHVADVAMEVDPRTGLLHYGYVWIWVPRQSGKTTLDLSGSIHRAHGMNRPQSTTYTAQTGKDARMKWRRDQLPLVRRSPFGSKMTPRLSNGDEGFEWHNGSFHSIIPPTDDGGHGMTLGRATIDEAFAHKDDAPEKGVEPAMITIDDAQMWVMSTAGDTPQDSPYLWGKVIAGRQLIEEANPESNICCFEWSAPDDMDPEDPATWWATMPALGHTISERKVRRVLEKAKATPVSGDLNKVEGLAGFERAYLNRWQILGQKDWQVISAARWLMAQREADESWRPTALGVDMTLDGTQIAIGASDGQWIDCTDSDTAGGWLKDRLVYLRETYGVRRCGLDSGSTAWALKDEIEAAGFEVVKATMSDVKVAYAQFIAGVRDGEIWHDGRPELHDAVKGATERTVGDACLWDRKSSDVNICPLVAVTIARWAALQAAEAAAPVFAY